MALQRKNIELGCGIKDWRWHEWWDSHYGWCKDWVSEAQVEDEQELRRVKMRKCVAEIRGYDDRGRR